MKESGKIQISAKDLSVTYFPGQKNEIRSLQGLNFSISEGEFIIFFGPSGCGKSTLLYSIAGLEKLEGDLAVEGVDLRKMTVKEKEKYHREQIGMIFQSFYLIPSLSVLQNVVLPLVAAGVSRKEREKKALALLDRFGVKSQARKLPNELSGGQQQRVAICRAVINNPKIVLADEPLGNLDSKSAAEVIELFKELNGALGKTLILVTHDPTYLDLAHRVFFIKDGALIDIKVNRPLGEKSAQEAGTAVSRQAFDFIDKHFSKLGKSAPSSLVQAYQAKNLTTLALLGLSSEEFDRLRDAIEHSLATKDDFRGVFNLLDKSSKDGGLDFDSRKALKITNKVRELFEELSASEDLPLVDADHERDLAVENKEKQVVAELRKLIFKELSLGIKGKKAIAKVDEAIQGRIDGDLDAQGLFVALDQPLPAGAGLDRRVALKIAKRLEVWLIEHKG